MANWMVLERLYGRIYMSMLWRRILISLAVAFVLGIGVGWLLNSVLHRPSPPLNLHIVQAK